jgi:hypothetical protein
LPNTNYRKKKVMKFKDEVIQQLNESDNLITTVINLIGKGSISPEDAMNKLISARIKIQKATERVELN